MVERDVFRDENFTIFLNPGYIKDAFKNSGWCGEDIIIWAQLVYGLMY